MDSLACRQALTYLLDSPGVINAAAQQLYERDSTPGDMRWQEYEDAFRELFVDEVRGSLTMLLEVLPEGKRRSLRAA